MFCLATRFSSSCTKVIKQGIFPVICNRYQLTDRQTYSRHTYNRYMDCLTVSWLSSLVIICIVVFLYPTGFRNLEELSVMKFMDKDDLKKNIKENLNVKKKRDSLHDQMPASNGVNHSNSGSLDRLSPFPNRSPAGPSPNVSTQHCHLVMQVRVRQGIGSQWLSS